MSTERAPKTIVITGASSGIGAAAARRLKAQGAEVVMVGRSPHTATLARELGCRHYLADFARLDDVRELANQLKRDLPRIDVLANNAGGIMGPRALTADGYELTIQVNYLAPFLLTQLLMDQLLDAKASVIATASVAHTGAGQLDPADFTLARGYSPEAAYRTAKLMNILFTRELHKRYHERGLSAAAFHPGVVRTGFASGGGSTWGLIFNSPLRHFLLSPERGADTLVWLAESKPSVEWQSGGYYYRRRLKNPSQQARDDHLAHDLWEHSLKTMMPATEPPPLQSVL